MMEFEYWWLMALPLFFALGWLAARVDINQLLSESSILPAAYFKGLNFLISDQHDKAIEAFIEAVEANADSLELHFALGSLFRRRGEVDRAIHLHLNLLERKEIADPQKLAVMAELAQDYLKAGLFDRAEELFRSLDQTPRYQLPALRALQEIYVREREWERAIETARELEKVSIVSMRKEIAQYYCELAVKYQHANDTRSARQQLELALESNKNCVRANAMLGDMEEAAGAHENAIAMWKRIELQQPQYLGLIALRMLKSYKALGKTPQGLAQMESYLKKYNLPSLLNVVYEAVLAEQGAAAAAQLARKELAHQPSLQLLDQFLQAQTEAGNGDPQDTQLMRHTIRTFLGSHSAYLCEQCGFRARHYHWQCPACNNWESFPPEPNELNP